MDIFEIIKDGKIILKGNIKNKGWKSNRKFLRKETLKKKIILQKIICNNPKNEAIAYIYNTKGEIITRFILTNSN